MAIDNEKLTEKVKLMEEEVKNTNAQRDKLKDLCKTLQSANKAKNSPDKVTTSPNASKISRILHLIAIINKYIKIYPKILTFKKLLQHTCSYSRSTTSGTSMTNFMSTKDQICQTVFESETENLKNVKLTSDIFPKLKSYLKK